MSFHLSRPRCLGKCDFLELLFFLWSKSRPPALPEDSLQILDLICTDKDQTDI